MRFSLVDNGVKLTLVVKDIGKTDLVHTVTKHLEHISNLKLQGGNS